MHAQTVGLAARPASFVAKRSQTSRAVADNSIAAVKSCFPVIVLPSLRSARAHCQHASVRHLLVGSLIPLMFPHPSLVPSSESSLCSWLFAVSGGSN